MSEPPTVAVNLAQALGAILEMPARLSALEKGLHELRVEVAGLREAMPATLFTVPEAARRLGVSVSTVRRRIRSGEIPVLRLGSAIRVEIAALRPADQSEVARLAVAARRLR